MKSDMAQKWAKFREQWTRLWARFVWKLWHLLWSMKDLDPVVAGMWRNLGRSHRPRTCKVKDGVRHMVLPAFTRGYGASLETYWPTNGCAYRSQSVLHDPREYGAKFGRNGDYPGEIQGTHLMTNPHGGPWTNGYWIPWWFNNHGASSFFDLGRGWVRFQSHPIGPGYCAIGVLIFRWFAWSRRGFRRIYVAVLYQRGGQLPSVQLFGAGDMQRAFLRHESVRDKYSHTYTSEWSGADESTWGGGFVRWKSFLNIPGRPADWCGGDAYSMTVSPEMVAVIETVFPELGKAKEQSWEDFPQSEKDPVHGRSHAKAA